MNKDTIVNTSKDRILLLDGAMGTMIQKFNLSEKDFRGEKFCNHNTNLKGCNDILSITKPSVIEEIHMQYLLAGADIITTNSFNSNAISLNDYNLQEYVYEINFAAATLAKKSISKFYASEASTSTNASKASEASKSPNVHKSRFIAGTMGPTGASCSIAADIENPAARSVTFDVLKGTYREQAKGLIDGGVDILILETVFDTLNAKAALMAIDEVCSSKGIEIPVMVSGTLTDSGRTLAGQTVEAFYYSLNHAKLFSIGLNCSFGAKQLLPYIKRLSDIAECNISAHPNAGLPNVMGEYEQTPQMFADDMEEYLKFGIVNIVGGCCGTTPEHIKALNSRINRYIPRKHPVTKRSTIVCGLEPLSITENTNFVNIGERTNVAGSAKFARLIREGNYAEAVKIAGNMVESGAQVIDVCMDDGMIDGAAAMTTFLNLIASEPSIAKIPVMIDSSKWEVLEAGLKCTQGKSIVNSISLKEGENIFIKRALKIHEYGAAAVVMLFDEKGQADTFERKIEVAERAYRLLTENGFPAEDIIIDPNILAVATGIESHNRYALDFINACRWIKQNLEGVKISGGVSNLSFSFRGNNKVREAMHSVFLYHAIKAGMDMGIVNPGMLQIYSDIEPELLKLCEDVILCRRADATERLSTYAQKIKDESAQQDSNMTMEQQLGSLPVEERIKRSIVKGSDDNIANYVINAFEKQGCSPLELIDTLLMPSMGEVGKLFGAGKMFLPQVVKSARVMKKAVEALSPYIKEKETSSSKAGKVVMATVKGDVHDIGKNIVSLVLSCNGYDVKDLGVMVESNTIADEVMQLGADFVGLSGLITPSLEEMIKVVKEFERRGIKADVVIGGATTSDLHTAVKIAPHYSGVVVHSKNASDNAGILNRLKGANRQSFIEEIKRNQKELRDSYLNHQNDHKTKIFSQAIVCRHKKNLNNIVKPNNLGITVYKDFPIKEVEPLINWSYLFSAWELNGVYPQILDSPQKGMEAAQLYEDANRLLKQIKNEHLLILNGVIGIFPANSRDNDIIVDTLSGSRLLPQLRNQEADNCENLCVADYIAPIGTVKDYIVLFAVTAGIGLKQLSYSFKEKGDDYNAIMSKLLCDRLTEAFAETIHRKVRQGLWGYEKDCSMPPDDIIKEKYKGRRFAFGYPATPDHSLKKDVFEILDVENNTGMRLTENFMIDPGEALCGMMIGDPEVKYFSVGKIGDDQMEEYSKKRGMETDIIKKLTNRI